MHRRALSRVLAEIVVIIVVLAGAAGAYFVYSTYYSSSAYGVEYVASAYAVGNKIVLNVKNTGSYTITSVNITFSSPYLGKFETQNVNIAPGKNEVLVFQCQNVPETAVAKLVVEAEGNGGRKSNVVAAQVIQYSIQGGGGGGGGGGGDGTLEPLTQNPLNLEPSGGTVYPPYGERSAFVAAGRVWVFWKDPGVGGSIKYYVDSAPLSDLSQWTDPDDISFYIGVSDSTRLASIWFDGQYFHFLKLQTSGTTYIYYTRATPNSDGTLTFGSTVEVDVREVDSNIWEVCNSGAIAVDGQGKVWIAVTAAYDVDWENGISKWKHLLLWHDENDGDFTIDGYYLLGGYTLNDWRPYIAVSGQFIMLSGGELHYLYVPYSPNNTPLNCSSYLYDARKTGTVWSKETVYSNTVQPAFSATTDGLNIHVTFLDTENHIHYMIRSADNHLWGGHQLIYSSNPVSSLTLTMLGNKVYCIWVDNGESIKCLYRDSSWSSQPQTLVSGLSCDTPSLVNTYYVLAPSSNTNVLPLFWIGDCSEGSGTTFYFQAFQIQQ
jgi:hypothetical protein